MRVSTSSVQGINLYPNGGRWFSDAGVQELPAKDGKPAGTAVQAVLGEGIAGILGKDQNKPSLVVGDFFELGGRQWVVSGIMQTSGSMFGSEIWAKRSVVGPMFGKDQITCMVVRTADEAAAKALGEDLSKNYKPAVRAEPQMVYYSKLSDTNKQFLGAIIFVAVIMAIGGVFGVMNTMFAAISQRTKDIGVLRILGFALADPHLLFPGDAFLGPPRRHAWLRLGVLFRRLAGDQHFEQWSGRRQNRRAQNGGGRQDHRRGLALHFDHGLAGRLHPGLVGHAPQGPGFIEVTLGSFAMSHSLLESSK